MPDPVLEALARIEARLADLNEQVADICRWIVETTPEREARMAEELRASGLREDLGEIIANISPSEEPFPLGGPSRGPIRPHAGPARMRLAQNSNPKRSA